MVSADAFVQRCARSDRRVSCCKVKRKGGPREEEKWNLVLLPDRGIVGSDCPGAVLLVLNLFVSMEAQRCFCTSHNGIFTCVRRERVDLNFWQMKTEML